MADATITADAGLVRLTFAIDGYERVSVGLSRWAQQVQDFRPFWRTVVAPWFFEQIQQNFRREGAPVGGWRPLSPRYAAWKAKHYPGKTILRRTDRLIQSLIWTGATLGLRGDRVAEFSATGAVFGTRVPYARPHQFGAGRLPQRRILYLPPNASRTLGRLLHRWAYAQATSLGTTVGAPSPVMPGPGGGLL
jgi:phage gpG-like protein